MICKCLLFSVITMLCTVIGKNPKGTSYVNNHLYSAGTHAVATKNGKPGAHDFHSPAKYSFEYGVSDHLTGDNKKQFEEREGDKVRGYYSFLDADGSIRTVHYTVDKENGFQAVVERSDA